MELLQPLLSIGEGRFVIPAILIVSGMALVNWLAGFIQRRSQQRYEFLEQWRQRPVGDTLWTQVALQHLLGKRLPQPVLTFALACENQADTLFDFAMAWDFMAWDLQEPGRLRWKKPFHEIAWQRQLSRWVLRLGYFVLALIGLELLGLSRSPQETSHWILGFDGLVFVAAGFVLLNHAERLARASELVPTLLRRFNVGRPTAIQIAPVAASTAAPSGVP